MYTKGKFEVLLSIFVSGALYLLYLLLSVAIGSSGEIVSFGRVKTIMNTTPLLCGDFVDMNISIGVSNSSNSQYYILDDIWMNLNSPDHIKIAKEAQESGKLVKVTYDYARYAPCRNKSDVTKIEILENNDNNGNSK